MLYVFSLGMEDTTLTLEQIERIPAASRGISSVRIREFDDSTANPEPIAQDEEADQLLEEFLSPSKLVGVASLLYRLFPLERLKKPNVYGCAVPENIPTSLWKVFWFGTPTLISPPLWKFLIEVYTFLKKSLAFEIPSPSQNF